MESLLAPGGALTAEACEQRLAKRVAELEPAIAVHAAHWGGARSDPPRTKKDWRGAVARLLDYLRQRPAIFRDQLRGSKAFALGDPGQHLYMAPLYPWVPAPQIWKPLLSSSEVVMSSEEGDIWYSFSENDPRAEKALSFDGAGQVNTELLFGDEQHLRICPIGREPSGEAWTSLDFDDADWLATEAGSVVTESIDPHDDASLNDRNVAFVRARFDVPDSARLVDLRLRLHYEDGYIAYLNGEKIATHAKNAFG